MKEKVKKASKSFFGDVYKGFSVAIGTSLFTYMVLTPMEMPSLDIMKEQLASFFSREDKTIKHTLLSFESVEKAQSFADHINSTSGITCKVEKNDEDKFNVFITFKDHEERERKLGTIQIAIGFDYKEYANAHQ